jgi:Domain of unknown function (DUF5666)
MNNKPMTHKNILFLFLAAGVFGILGVAVISAQASGGGFMGYGGGNGRMGGGQPGVFGKVTGVDTGAMTITLQDMRNSATSYSVDASNAVIVKNNITSTISAVAVGDTVVVRGTVNGAVVTATMVRDNVMGANGRGFSGRPGMRTPTGTFPGGRPSGTFPYASGTRPLVPQTTSGTIASVNGSTLTVTGTDGTTYTVDASNATLVKKGSTANAISAINVGDTVRIQGAVNGTSITATAILDNVAQNPVASGSGFLGTIKNFLSNLFHFKF